MGDDRTPELRALIETAEAAAAGAPDQVAEVVKATRRAIAGSADPYLLAGALVEGIAMTVASRVPEAKRGGVAIETVRLLRDRLVAHKAV